MRLSFHEVQGGVEELDRHLFTPLGPLHLLREDDEAVGPHHGFEDP